MPKISIGKDFSKTDAAVGFDTYAGPTPPKGVYDTKVTYARLTTNSNDDYMVKMIFTVDEAKGSPKAKFNGYAIWHNANLTEVSAPYVNAMLDALGVNRKKFWDGLVVDPKDGETITKFGDKKPDTLRALVTTKRREYPVGSGEWNLSTVSFAKSVRGSGEGSDGGDADEDLDLDLDNDDLDDEGDDGDEDGEYGF